MLLKLETTSEVQQRAIRKQEKAIQKQEKAIQKHEKVIQRKEGTIQSKEKDIQKHQKEAEWLRFQLAQLKRMLFGSKRERFEADGSQTKIEFEEYASKELQQDETPVKETITYEREKSAKKHNGRNSIPDHLPVVECIIKPEEDTSGMKKIGEERTEILEYVPEKFFRLVLIREKYARLAQEDEAGEAGTKNVIIGDLPSRPIDKCLAGNSLLAAILINKYVDHLPLYRRQQIFKRSDIEIAPSTIDTWIAHLGKLFESLYQRLVDEVKAQSYLQADETTAKVLDRTKKKTTHLGYY
ncbi:MAG: transposase, partial [Cryomorphaceae bacterium]